MVDCILLHDCFFFCCEMQSYTASELARSRGPDDTSTIISGGSGGAGDAPVEGHVAEKIVGGTMMEPRDALRIGR